MTCDARINNAARCGMSANNRMRGQPDPLHFCDHHAAERPLPSEGFSVPPEHPQSEALRRHRGVA